MSEKAFEVHVFLATGVAQGVKAAGGAASAGKRYSLLIFSRQPEGKAADKRRAREGAATAGWKDVKLERSRVLAVGETPADPILKAAFDEALREGCAVVAYKKPLAPA
ncbi:MAG TPA: hypothetical protein VF262_09730 [Burkholderiales bacterium]